MPDQLPPGPPLPPADGPPSPPAPEPWRSPTLDPPQPRRRSRALLALAVFVVLLLAGVTIGLQLGGDDGGGPESAADSPAGNDGDDEDDDASPSGNDGDDEEPEPEPLDEEAVAALVDELSAYVEEERGLEFREEVDLEVLDAEAYRERIEREAEDDLEEGVEDLEHAAGILQALGLWPPGTDPVEVVTRFTAAASIGFYDPVDAEMVILGSADTPNLRVTLVHELTHALDDQHFDLERLKELGDREDEAGAAFQALVEGNAGRVDTTYEATLSEEEQQSIIDEQLASIEDVDLTGIPPVLFAQQQLIYEEGEAFATAVHEVGGNEAIDAALRRPPTTSEQILEPEGWPDREPVTDVEAPEADGEVLEDGVVGQGALGLLVDAGGEDADDVEWDGDHAVLWEDGDEFCTRIAIAVADGEVSYEEALAPWAEQVGAEIEVEGDRLVVTSCN